MEVHHHPKVEKKNFKEYLFEGLMIFLAVMLGFFAENSREHLNNKERERNYMISLVRDLKIDTARVTRTMGDLTFLSNEMDSSLRIPINQLSDLNLQDTFYCHFLSYFNYMPVFHNDDNTLIQLRNAGGYSVIEKPRVTDSVIALVSLLERVKYNEDFYHEDFKGVEDCANHLIIIPYLPTLADGSTVFPKMFQNTRLFTSTDEASLQQLYSLIRIEQSQLQYYKYVLEKFKEQAAMQIVFLRKEYNIENE